MLDFTVTVSRDDYYAANAAVLFKAWSLRAVLIGFACGTLLYAAIVSVTADIVTLQEGGHMDLGLIIGAIAAAAAMAIRFGTCWFSLSSTSNTLYAQIGTLELPTRHQLSPERFRTSYDEGTSDHPWSRFCDYIDAGNVLLLRRTPSFMYVIPLHQLPAATREELLSLLAQVGVKRG